MKNLINNMKEKLYNAFKIPEENLVMLGPKYDTKTILPLKREFPKNKINRHYCWDKDKIIAYNDYVKYQGISNDIFYAVLVNTNKLVKNKEKKYVPKLKQTWIFINKNWLEENFILGDEEKC